MNDALFADTGHALHVAFLVLAMPPRQKSPFRQMLIHVLESIEAPSKQQAAWLDQLRGNQTFDPDRLTMDEFRAQCAMITDAARSRLPGPEYAAVLARFAHDRQRIEGFKRLAIWSRRSHGITALGLLTDLIAYNYLPRAQREALSLRKIGDQHKVSKDAVFRAVKTMRLQFAALELRAMDRLDALFLEHGVIANRTVSDSSQSVVA